MENTVTTASSLQAFFRNAGDFRFSPAKCRDAGLRVVEAKFLKCLALAPRDNRWVMQHFGMGQAWHLARRGLVDNPLGETVDAHTNLWQLTDEGVRVLSMAAGVPEAMP